MIKPNEARGMMPRNQRNCKNDKKTMTSWVEKAIRDAAGDNCYSAELVLQKYPDFDRKNRPYWVSTFLDVLQEFRDCGYMVWSSYLSSPTWTTYVICWEP